MFLDGPILNNMSCALLWATYINMRFDLIAWIKVRTSVRKFLLLYSVANRFANLYQGMKHLHSAIPDFKSKSKYYFGHGVKLILIVCQ